jgi:hypothetical protein
VPPIGGSGPFNVISTPLPRLAKLRLSTKTSPSKPGTHKILLSYTLTATGKVKVAIYRRTTGHSCRGAGPCVRWVPTKIKLTAAGHAGVNVLAVSLGTLSAGAYRVSAMPLTPSGAPGITQYIPFKLT